MDLYERVRKLEEIVKDLMGRIENIERALRLLGIDQPMLTIASKLVISFSMPAVKALEAASRVLNVLRKVVIRDPISISIIEVLSGCESLSISEITRRVRVLRGSASRRVIRERLRDLEDRGVVVNVGNESRPKYILTECIEELAYE